MPISWLVFFPAVWLGIACFGDIMGGGFGSSSLIQSLMAPEFSMGWFFTVGGDLWNALSWNFAIFTSHPIGQIVRVVLLGAISVGVGVWFITTIAGLIRGGS